MRELRTQENEKFEEFFNIVREEANKTDSVFFVDCGEGREIITDTLEGEDLSGWLIPKNQADKFEKEWRGANVNDRWNKFWRFAIWNNENGVIRVEFKQF